MKFLVLVLDSILKLIGYSLTLVMGIVWFVIVMMTIIAIVNLIYPIAQ